MNFHVSLRGLAMGLVLAVLACAGERPPPETSVASRRAIHEALEELPGVVLAGRHFALFGEVRMVVAAPDSQRAAEALAGAFAVTDSVCALTCPQRAGSEVGRINAAAGGDAVTVSPWTEKMVAVALEWAERTNGAFDPTVGPVVEAWGFSGDLVRVPTNDEIEAARRLVEWRNVRHDAARHTVLLTEAGMQLDLRALAKGFALDRMREAMMEAGATSGIADFDGDLMFFGPGTESHDDRWPIQAPDPYDPTRSYARFELPAGGFSTSSYYDRLVEIEGEQYGHILDPRTGWPVRGLASVSVYASEAIVNDVLSTALFVLGADEGLRLAEDLHDVEAVFVVDAQPGQRSRVVTTAGIRRYLKDLDPPRRPVMAEDE